ncbi:histidine phosphatase family protein [Cytobacillus sp. FJAT-54145]|uniref:Histidine phosphatase family protein n=1 Tax=Cytobacillus spartinae TaxID=3299023 RepID=A0ABW6K9V4_9BACI
MYTYIYFVRHGESPKEGDERTRKLTEKGILDAQRITSILINEEVDTVVSSPYLRAIQTVEKVAQHIGKEVLVMEDLKERIFTSKNHRISDKELIPLLERSFSEPNYALDGGESNADCQKRAIRSIKELLENYRGKRIAIGTHGAVMTLAMQHFDSRYDLNFLHSTSKPDIYRMKFKENSLVEIKRLWGNVVYQ